jgi:hypothetical protein
VGKEDGMRGRRVEKSGAGNRKADASRIEKWGKEGKRKTSWS